jgi:uncharacterized protein YndB with AHSA1/START domain
MDWELKMSRVYDAPRKLVFEAWSKAEHVSQWFAPKPLTVPDCELEFKSGGKWDLTMQFPDGQKHMMKGHYREVTPIERIVFVSYLNDQPKGHEIVATVTFTEEGGKTRLDVHQTYKGLSVKLDAEAGWTSTLDNLGDFVAKSKAEKR